MNPIKLLWLIVAMLLMSYVSLGRVLDNRAVAQGYEEAP